MLRLAATLLAAAVPALPSPFVQAAPGYQFEFPRDHFEHPEFSTEWWYYTGNLETGRGRRFGFELTFFRVGLRRAGPLTGTWSLDQIYLAHFALTDVEGGRLLRAERANRAGPGLAGASEKSRTVWNGNWSVVFLPGDPLRPAQRLHASLDGAAVDLLLEPAKAVVVHGTNGVSRKAGGAGEASHYASFTRLVAGGTVALDGQEHQVKGLAWMDHEFFSAGLPADLAGWDWMSIQLDDGSDLMLYGLRGRGGAHSRFSSGTLVHPDGRTLRLGAGDFTLTPGRTWQSEESGAVYPVEWSIKVPGLDLELASRPLLDQQELVSPLGYTPVYWEGAVTYAGERRGRPVVGRGYLEMTGYDKPFELPGRDQR